MDIRYPEYGNCIANLACSILRCYGAEAPNPTMKQADSLLNREYKNIVLLLLDGMEPARLKPICTKKVSSDAICAARIRPHFRQRPLPLQRPL